MRSIGASSYFAIFILLFHLPDILSISHRTWNCIDQKCVKNYTENFDQSVSVQECKSTCLPYAGLWPKPTGTLNVGQSPVPVDVTSIVFEREELPEDTDHLVTEAENVFNQRVQAGSNGDTATNPADVYTLSVNLKITDPSITNVATGIKEGYKLEMTSDSSSKKITATITGETYFGLRHGLETLSQLFFFDDLHKVYKILGDANIEDKPAFTFRGMAVDTGRSYIPLSVILKTLDAMSINKLNSFHWHITDSHSFPYVSKAYPELSQLGAYSDSEVYTAEDIKKVVEYARVRGIRVIPEFDAPAHVGEGWDALGTDLITCFKWEPWSTYCVEPPCGQFDPTNEKVYEILGGIYKEYVDLFPSDLFHMGGDEVNINCWRSTPRIVDWMSKNNYSSTDEGFHDVWSYYQKKALDKLKATKSNPPTAILWTSSLTESTHINKYLNPEDYIIHIWTKGNDPEIGKLIENKFRVVFSTYDELYFDCGAASWIGGPGQNWCSPYINWQTVYSHSPHKILQNLGIPITDEVEKLLLGSEAELWTEQLDGAGIELRHWPRGAALAERLWTNPETVDLINTRYRLNHQRDRLAKNKINADVHQPQFCYQNDGHCE